MANKNPKKQERPSLSQKAPMMKKSAIAKAKRHRKAEENNFSAELSQDTPFLEEERDEDRSEINDKSFLENDDFYYLRTNVHQREV